MITRAELEEIENRAKAPYNCGTNNPEIILLAGALREAYDLLEEWEEEGGHIRKEDNPTSYYCPYCRWAARTYPIHGNIIHDDDCLTVRTRRVLPPDWSER